MVLNSVLTVLYGLSGFISLAGYIPQFLAFRKDVQACRTTPVSTWMLWLIQAAIVEIYAVFVNGDPMFMMSASFSLAAITACTVVLLIGRARKAKVQSKVVPFPGKVAA